MKQLWPVLSLGWVFLLPVFSMAETSITPTEVWARETPPGSTNGAVYLTLTNRSKTPDRLTGISGDVATAIELHTMLMENNVMKMRRMDVLTVAPGTPVMLKPGGMHLMLIGLKQPLVAGHTFPLRLHFERAGDIPVEVSVRRMDGQMPHTHGAMDHGKHAH
jgi:copper(I)-binding protein